MTWREDFERMASDEQPTLDHADGSEGPWAVNQRALRLFAEALARGLLRAAAAEMQRLGLGGAAGSPEMAATEELIERVWSEAQEKARQVGR